MKKCQVNLIYLDLYHSRAKNSASFRVQADLLIGGIDNEGPSLYFMVVISDLSTQCPD